MLKGHLFIQAFISFIVLPGIFAFFVPLIVSYVDPWNNPFFAPGIIVVGIGTVLLLWCIRDFYVAGKGTLAPWNPPQNLVIVGLYRYVRNPMYLSVLFVVLGWGLFYWSPMLIAYDILLFTVFYFRVVKFEEPQLHDQFGKSWETYKENVPRWLPRKTEWEKF